MALTFGEKGYEHIRAGHLLAARILHVQNRALNNALETRCRFRVFTILDDKRQEFMIDVFDEGAPQSLEVHIAGLHYLRGIRIVEQSQKQMLKRRVLVVTVARQLDGAVEHLFEAARQ
jgi:hypothetical protein